MVRYSRVLLHENGPAIWPDHKPNEEVIDLRATTPANIWSATYQGLPTSPAGAVFMREWWQSKNRYEPADRRLYRQAVRRWISCDTAGATSESAAYSCFIVFELTPEYRVLIREVQRARLPYPGLTPAIQALASKYYDPEPAVNTLCSVIIEDRSTGSPALQTLAATAEPWLQEMLWPFIPQEDKIMRAYRSAVYCKDGCIMLPYPDESVANWLTDFEDELFTFPESKFADHVDAFSQGVWCMRNWIQEGLMARHDAALRSAQQRVTAS
jgi:predicted phage terminase large subunit-like protein